MGDVEGRFGSLRATGFAGADSGAAGQLAHALGCDRVGSGPPMPTQLVHSGRRAATDFADRVWGQRRDHARRVHRIAFDTGHADRAIDLVVVGGQVVVGQRPVVADTVEASTCESRTAAAASIARRRARSFRRRRRSSPDADRCRRPLADNPPATRGYWGRALHFCWDSNSHSCLSPGNSSLLNHRPCSRQTTEKPCRAISLATTAPDGPAPMIRTSTVSVSVDGFAILI